MRIFGFVGVTGCGEPAFLAYPHVFLTCGPFIGCLGFFGVRQGYSCVAVDRQDDYSADSSAQPALRHPSGSGYTGSFGFSSPLGFPTFAMGSPLRGRGLSVLDRNEGLVSPLRSGTLVRSWLDYPPLSAGICTPGPSGCVARWSSLCPYPVVHLSSLQGSSGSLVRVQCYLPDPC